jgi:hypothetical protein
MGEVLTLPLSFVNTGGCVECGVPIVLDETFQRERRRDHRNFYCPNGHPQHYTGKSDVEKLQEQLAEKERFIENGKKRVEWAEQRAARERENTKRAQRSAASYKGKLKHVKTRVGNGVCPCCNRSFTDLMRHMQTKHPTYKGEE